MQKERIEKVSCDYCKKKYSETKCKECAKNLCYGCCIYSCNPKNKCKNSIIPICGDCDFFQPKCRVCGFNICDDCTKECDRCCKKTHKDCGVQCSTLNCRGFECGEQTFIRCKCSKAFCKNCKFYEYEKHVSKCKASENILDFCFICEEQTDSFLYKCSKCTKPICETHSFGKCGMLDCEKNENRYCPDCAVNLATCQECTGFYCNNHLEKCIDCKKTICCSKNGESCYKTCMNECNGTIYCKDCQIKNIIKNGYKFCLCNSKNCIKYLNFFNSNFRFEFPDVEETNNIKSINN